MPLNTTLEIAEPIFQPIGPKNACATMTVKTKLQKGTTIIETTGGKIVQNKKSGYCRLKKGFVCAKIKLL